VDQTILVALITALATLAGTLGSQLLAQRSQGTQWRQQRQDRRDDERLQHYANLLLVLGDWQNALGTAEENYEAYVEEQGEADPDDQDLRAFDGYRDAARRELAIIDLIAPSKTVRSGAREAVEAGEACYPDMFRGAPSSSRFRERRTALNDAMRNDLKLDSHAALASPDTSELPETR
jgi:hypothetical protein